MAISSLRLATSDDADRLGAIHVACWRESYDRILPREMLSKLTVEGRAAMWSKILADSDAAAGSAVWIAENDGRMVGFGSCGRQRDQMLMERGFDAEISAIYILRSCQGAGVGRAIMGAMASLLRERGNRAVSLWVLRENAPARGFYEHLGGAVVAEQEDARPEATLVEVAYGWHDLRSLIG
ncbi:GNAT family N-acetyltransferase [Methylosinus sp. RM1]|uniref:GNAT family N-acetyltransferase n=1 Tax=Methylosinus sp. RM1 TaxID=2583817 RepID=UPI00140E0A0C|nr:GNAT family N-acetyltransferase [Methylosinus sp. RM1]